MFLKALKILFIPLILNFPIFSNEPLVNLEALKQDFVLESKQIHIPLYPDAFNPSIVRWQGALLLSFRILPNKSNTFISDTGVIWLDDDFNPISEPQILNFREEYPNIDSRAADARFITVNDRLFIVYEDNRDKVISRGGFRVFIAELSVEGMDVHVENIECLSIFEGESQNVREKSWVPFNYNNNLLLAYSINPHLIFYPTFRNGECLTIATSHNDILWDYGTIRGGTQAMLIEDNQYLSFFHSSIFMSTLHSKGKNMTHYFIGAYTFNDTPPFSLSKISKAPIYGDHFYEGPIYKHYWKPIRAVFPCGFIMDGNDIWISYGRDDYEMWVVHIDKQKLLNTLINVEP